MLERLCTRFSATMRRLGDTRAEVVGATRFFRNPKVSAPEILATAVARTAEAAAGRHVALIEDTSEVNYAAKAGRKRDLGLVGNGVDIGLFVHPALAVDAVDGTVLGLAGATIWRRTTAKAANYQDLPIETKESHRWISTVTAARTALPDAAMVTVLADREADIYELFARLPKVGPDGLGTHLLVRCNHDRALVQPDATGRLHETVASWPVRGTFGFELTARPGRPARPVTLAVRFGSVTLRQPRPGATQADPHTVTLNLVEVSESDPPPGEKPVLWRLYTTHAVATLDDARMVVELYRRRWSVEQVFRTLKTQGVALEQSLIAEGAALENLAAASLVAAVKVMQCVQARGEAGSTISALRVFTRNDLPILKALVRRLEGRTLKQKNRQPPETLAWATWVIARLGGWTGYDRERPPGPITMLEGFARYTAIAEGFTLATLTDKEVCAR